MTETAAMTRETDFAAARKAMIESQLRTSGVSNDFVLTRMGSVAREDFVPASARSHAYMDRAIALDDGGYLAAPIVHGRMLAEARPVAEDKVLVVDGGSGYLPALLAPLVASVQTVSPAQAVEKTRKRGDFTLLMIDGAVEHLPDTLVKRLAEGARVVTGLAANGVTRVAIGRKVGGTVSLLPVADIGMPRLPEFDVAKGWSF